jgi:hypothetical protein
VSVEREIAEDVAEELVADVAMGLCEVDWNVVATLAGRDAQDRQAIKRKAARWRDNFASLDPLVRLAVLGAMAEGVRT